MKLTRQVVAVVFLVSPQLYAFDPIPISVTSGEVSAYNAGAAGGAGGKVRADGNNLYTYDATGKLVNTTATEVIATHSQTNEVFKGSPIHMGDGDTTGTLVGDVGELNGSGSSGKGYENTIDGTMGDEQPQMLGQ